MTSFAVSLKAEIARVARKELRDELLSLRKNSTSYRSEIAELKRKIKALQTQVNKLSKATRVAAPSAAARQGDTEGMTKRRSHAFKPPQLLAYRKNLGISQAQMASLLGASSLSVLKWETGKAMPRAAKLERIRETLKLGKRAALAQLSDLAE